MDTKKKILNRKTMLYYEKKPARLFYEIPITFILFIAGIFVIYSALNFTDIVSNKVLGIIFGGIICILIAWLYIAMIKRAYKILKGEYIVIIDELKDKKYFYDKNWDKDTGDSSRWLLYFKDFYKIYNKEISLFQKKEGEKYYVGEKFYLVFFEGDKFPQIFSTNKYILPEEDMDKITTFEDSKGFIKLKEYEEEEKK